MRELSKRLDVGIVLGPAFDPAGGAKRSDEGVLPLDVAGALEEFNIFGVGAGPAAFDERHAEFVQFAGHADFVVGRKVKPSDWVPSRRVVS